MKNTREKLLDREPLNYRKIKLLYDALRGDIEYLNKKIDKIGWEVKKEINKLNPANKKKLNRNERIKRTI